NSVADITAGSEIFLPANQNDMLSIWQHQGAWQPKALVPVTSEAAAKRAANITTPQTTQAPQTAQVLETQVLPSPPSEKVPVVGVANLPDPPKPQVQVQAQAQDDEKEDVDLGKLLESHRTAAQARRASIHNAIKESSKPDLKTLPVKKRAANNYNVPNNPIILLSPNGDPASGPMRLVISGDKVEVVQLPAEAAPKRPSLVNLDHTFGTIPDHLQPYMTLPPRRPGDNIVMPNLKALNGKMLWPVDGKVTSGFGPRGRRRHAGIDIPMPLNTPIRAAKGGIVARTGNNSTPGFRGYGNFVLMDHGGGIKTLYAHCSKVGVSEGMKIMQGQIVGYVGRTGRASTEHLHFEVRINDKPVNPIPYLVAHPQVASASQSRSPKKK
ncbi:MAG: M23 family metallopeptidase, partial [Synergistaceae bacterium]|nr:M23 family metallopeptidase [Synergistaceae bacterium]